MALARIRRDQSVTALYGFSGGGYNIAHIVRTLRPEERTRLKRIVVIGAPRNPPSLYRGPWELVYRGDPPEGHMAGPRVLLTSLGPENRKQSEDTSMAATSFEARAPINRGLWNSMKLTREAALDRDARKILAGRARYLAVEKATGVPWFLTGLKHMREASCNFAGVLHNGQHIIGKGTKTTIVPKGRGPFSSWESAAIDALKLKNLHAVKTWTIERIIYECERFNGFGYVINGYGNSPYVWAGSQHYVRGKYTSDGHYDSSHVDKQNGTMPTLKALCKISPEVNARVNGKPMAAPETAVAVGGGVATVAVAAQQGFGAMEWAIAAAIAVVVIAGIVWAIRKYRSKETTDLPPMTNEAALTADRAGVAEDDAMATAL